MTIDLLDPLDDQEVERRLRAMFSTVMPLLDAAPGEDDSMDTTVVPLLSRPAAARRSKGRRLVAALTAAAAVVGLVALVRHPIADGPTDASTTLPAAPPAWYGVIHPFLPDGFDQIALLEASSGLVRFSAWRPTTAEQIDVTVALGDALPPPATDTVTASDEVGDWYEFESFVEVVATTGLSVIVQCGMPPVAVALAEVGSPPCGDQPSGAAVDAEVLHAMAESLATEFPMDSVPTTFPQPTPVAADLPVAEWISAVRSDRPFQGWDVEGYHGAAVVAWLSPLSTPLTAVLTVINGVYPGGADPSVATMAMERMADPRSRFTQFGDVAVAWMVNADGVGFQIATTDLSDDNLLRLGGLIENLALQSTESAVATTLPGSPSTSSTDPGRELGDADRIAAFEAISAVMPGFERLQISPTLESFQAFDGADHVITATYRVIDADPPYGSTLPPVTVVGGEPATYLPQANGGILMVPFSTSEQVEVSCASSAGGLCLTFGSVPTSDLANIARDLLPLFRDAVSGNELSALATLRAITPPQDVSVDAAAAEAHFRDVVGATVIEFLPPVTGVAAAEFDQAVGFSIGDDGTVWVSIVSSSGVLFRALVDVPSIGVPFNAMRELVDFVVQPGTEVAVTEP